MLRLSCPPIYAQVLLLHLKDGSERLVGQSEPLSALRSSSVQKVFLLSKQVFEIDGACEYDWPR